MLLLNRFSERRYPVLDTPIHLLAVGCDVIVHGCVLELFLEPMRDPQIALLEAIHPIGLFAILSPKPAYALR